MPARYKTTRRILPTLLLLLVAPADAVERKLLLSPHRAVVDMRAAAMMMSGQQGGDLPIAIAAVPDGKTCGGNRRGSAFKCRFTALIEIDGAALLETSPEASLKVEILAYVLGADLDVLEQQSLVLDAGRPDDRELLTNTGLKAFLRLEVASGEHLLRVLVHAGQSFGLRSLNLYAGTPARDPSNGAAPRIQAPVFHELIEPWLLAAPADVEIPLPPPFALEAPAPLPAARPQMPVGGTLTGHIFAPLTESDNHSKAAELTALLRPPGGEGAEAPLTVVDRVAGEGVESLTISFTPPPDVGPGLWQLAVAGTDAIPRSDFVSIFIEDPSPALTATGLEKDDRAGPRPRPLPKAQRKLARAAREGYVRALRELAAGDSRAALKMLAASEQPVFDALDAGAVDVLSQSEARVLATLPDADWDCLLPVILLHLDVSRFYRAQGRRILAHHATQMTLDLANAYARKLDSPRAAAEAARALSSLAGYFQHSGSRFRAEKLFIQALELAPEPTALLGLGTLYEKSGRSEAAVPLFERLVATSPDYREGALRLALNQARVGNPAPARKALRRLVANGDDGWILVLAHQELARLLIDNDQVSQAEAVLRRGLKRWPSHPTLGLQLAWVLDTRGELEASFQLLEGLEPSATRGANERSRYNRWPDSLLADSRLKLAEVAATRLADLESWLDRQASIDD